MDRARRVHRARVGHLAHHQRRLGNAQSAAAVCLRNCDAEIAGRGEGAIELVRELVARIVTAPVGIGKALAQRAHSGDDLALRLGKFEIHV